MPKRNKILFTLGLNVRPAREAKTTHARKTRLARSFDPTCNPRRVFEFHEFSPNDRSTLSRFVLENLAEL